MFVWRLEHSLELNEDYTNICQFVWDANTGNMSWNIFSFMAYRNCNCLYIATINSIRTMNARIDIKTPSGNSLEGFPLTMNPVQFEIGDTDVYVYPIEEPNTYRKWTLHKGDIITIEVL